MNNLATVLSGDGLSELSKPATPPSSLKRIRDIHHYIARLVAEGRRTTDIAREVGYSISRISILKGDPAFQQLVEMIRPKVEELRDMAYADAVKQKALIRQISNEEILWRLEEQPETFTNSELLAHVNDGDDRLGDLPKITRSINANLNASFNPQYLADREASGRRRLDQLSAPPPPGALKAGTDSQPAAPFPPQVSSNGVAHMNGAEDNPNVPAQPDPPIPPPSHVPPEPKHPIGFPGSKDDIPIDEPGKNPEGKP
jgi:hypothetical protein